VELGRDYVVPQCVAERLRLEHGRAAGWPKEKIDAILIEAKSGNYKQLLATMAKYFDIG
jgi:hypothetical protein